MNKEKEQVEVILSNLSSERVLILSEILQAEKNIQHRKNMQGTGIINNIVDIIKERVK
ncbi:TPA: hypothetical protein QCR51_004369 [Bacillus cereus]|nr:hypothetical protein [Bacillus cereus]MCU4893264.1 hypothetical protein [Bacillus cereus]HDR4947815.1 hypothetical protein [Bacillus cereus]HDR7163647.1 hypothetical protein [Bacillus cereus]